MRGSLAALFLVLFVVTPARADIAAARDAYRAGAYADAAQAGEAAGGAEGLALASHALIANYLIGARGQATLLDRAVSDGERALALDPKSVDARLSLAVALGVKGRRANLAEVWHKGYAQRGKRLIEEALALDPHNARAIALMGSWNLEVVRRAGKVGAAMLGAGSDRGIAAFERARAAAPNDPAIAFQYAIALLSLDPAKHSARVADLLSATASCSPRDAFETALHEEARRLGAVLASSGALAAGQAVNARFL